MTSDIPTTPKALLGQGLCWSLPDLPAFSDKPMLEIAGKWRVFRLNSLSCKVLGIAGRPEANEGGAGAMAARIAILILDIAPGIGIMPSTRIQS